MEQALVSSFSFHICSTDANYLIFFITKPHVFFFLNPEQHANYRVYIIYVYIAYYILVYRHSAWSTEQALTRHAPKWAFYLYAYLYMIWVSFFLNHIHTYMWQILICHVPTWASVLILYITIYDIEYTWASLLII